MSSSVLPSSSSDFDDIDATASATKITVTEIASDQPNNYDKPAAFRRLRKSGVSALGDWARSTCAIDARSAMWTVSLCMVLLGLASCCVSLPQVQYVNDKPYHLKQFMECRGGKDMEINQVRDIDECKSVCVYRRCKALNLFQLGEFEFKCEILRYVDDIVPAQGAACYVTYF